MSYLDRSHRPSPTSMAAVIAIHAGIGAALILGLSVAGGVIEKDAPIPAFNVKDPPPPPPVEPETPPAAATPPTSPPITAPQPRLDLKPVPPNVDVRDIVLPPNPPVPIPRPSATITPVVSQPVPKVDPVAARPRNDPLRWVTNDDYRSSWIRQEMTGTARFRLEIAANGAVSSCTITGSTGHPALDEATCGLISRRAKFQPARGSDGEPVAGSYSSAVRWILPE
jgi:periplasmic protein TonB